MMRPVWWYAARFGGLVFAGFLLSAGSTAQADSKDQLMLSPTDHGLLRFVERHSIGVGDWQFRRHSGEFYYRPYGYRVYPYSRTDPGVDVGAIRPAGRLIVTARPADAMVFVDGHPLAREADNTFQIGVLVGAHRLEVRAPGYTTHQQDVDVRVGNHHRLDVVLKPE